ncbi:MAG TPA: anti-sigma factor [Caulobacteraceae bacterium]|nr:anti-sigma factor [Caulobacteraceae bacterium]
MSACPDKELLLHALADGELDAGNVLALEAHIASCPACAEELAAIEAVRAHLAAAPLAFAAPSGLLDRVESALAAAEAPPPRRRRFLGLDTLVLSGSGMAIAASIALASLAPAGASLQLELVDAQARSLEASHLVDVMTSDRHTVKPWFNGKVDFAPPVVDLASQGYPLVGGRLDRIDGRRVAALVFRRRAHVINLFIWPGDTPPQAQLRRKDGYSLVRWGAGGLVFWAVSDVDSPDLLGFQQAFAGATKT